MEKRESKTDSRVLGAAVKAAEMLSDTTKYDVRKGVLLEQLFSKSDLEYIAGRGISEVVNLFHLINTHLPKDKNIGFNTGQDETVKIADNPLVLKDLRVFVSSKPALINNNTDQWKENVYRAYLARDYGTQLNNTITITSATREIRETPALELLNFDGRPITLSQILQNQSAGKKSKYAAEKAAVAMFRSLTVPGPKMRPENANENYRRALFELMRLQEADIRRHPETQKLLVALTDDLKRGTRSNVIEALRNSPFFDANVPGNLGPVLLTEDQVINPGQVGSNAESKATELLMLTALHYGERDAVKLFRQLINGSGLLQASHTSMFTPNRLKELMDHGTEKMKSLGYGRDKTEKMTISDLVLVAVASPEAPEPYQQQAFITLHNVSAGIVNQYTITEVQETRHVVLFNPRIKLGSRHTEYRTSFDPVEYVPDYVTINGEDVRQTGSRITQNGVELRVESDLYFSSPERIFKSGVKPQFFPEFGILAGAGRRHVGYDDKTLPGLHGPVPKFDHNYFTWGGHIGLNGGPFLLSADATLLSASEMNDPYERFFDLSQGMTYYRYSLLTHVANLGIGKWRDGEGGSLIVDLELAGESNNEGTTNHSHTQSGAAQTGSGEWRRDYERAHPGGVYNAQIATEMILNGDVKASYAASNFAALHAGIQKSNFLLKATVGLYNVQTIEDYHEGASKWVGKLFSNTMKGNLFGAIGLTYNFGSMSLTEKRKKTESYQTNSQGDKSSSQATESSTSKKVSFSPRDHAIFTNRRSKSSI